MFGKKSAIKKYIRQLSPELEKRYGVHGPYTQVQVGTTVSDLGLSHRYIHYAYLIYCDQKIVISDNNIPQEQAGSMCRQIENVANGGVLASLVIGAFSGDSDSGGFGDGGGGE